MKNERIRILYVDDETNNLSAFRATFRRSYEVYTAISAEEGKKILQEIPLHVIIADQRMPGVSGVEFFKSIKEHYPDPVRILLTGYSDMEALIGAINNGEIFRYLKKPWDEFELRNAIHNAYEIFNTRRQLNIKIKELEKTNDELNRFIYSTSHDLRSPLMSVLGIISLSRMEQSITDPNGYIDMIEACVNRLDGFIQKIIEYYKNSRIDIDLEKIDFKTLLKDCVDICSAHNPAIRFTTEVDQPFPFTGDAFRIMIILNNLISNAVKYQKPDEPHPAVNLSVKVEPHRALIKIEDNGIGILSEHLSNIFKMFFRTNNTKTGSGIGLYIVKEALTRIGGQISVKSTYGVGSTFEINIPNRNEFDQ